MFKRLIALIGVLVLVFTLTIPCFADVTYDYEDELNVHDVDESFDGPVLFLQGNIDIDVRNSSGASVGYSYSELYIYCYGGQLCAFSPKSMDEIFFCDGSKLYLYDTAGASVGSFSGSSYTITIGYFESDIIYASTSCSTWGFTCDSTEGGSSSGGFTQEDLDNAYDEGVRDGLTQAEGESYNQGFTDGVASVDQDAIRQEGYDEGFTEGQESIDQEAIRQEGYDEGFTEGQESIDQDAIRQEGYDEGFTEGQESIDQDAIRQEGYEAALKDCGEYADSFFKHCVFTAIITGAYPSDGSQYKHSFSFTPNYIYSGVTFDSLYAQVNDFLINTVNDPYWDYIDRVTIQMVWEDDYIFDYRTLPLYITGDYDVNYGELYTSAGVFYSLDADLGNSSYKRQFIADTSVNSILTKQINIWVGRPADLLTSFTLYASSESYNNGYSDGYSIGYSEGQDYGFNDAYQDGFTDGKSEGLNLSKSGSWTELMTAVVEAPINTFQSLFNFEVLGLDMRAAFGSILALCVILIIVKKVIL